MNLRGSTDSCVPYVKTSEKLLWDVDTVNNGFTPLSQYQQHCEGEEDPFLPSPLNDDAINLPDPPLGVPGKGKERVEEGVPFSSWPLESIWRHILDYYITIKLFTTHTLSALHKYY